MTSQGYVVDASVAVKWLLPEADSPRARALIASGALLWAPDLLLAEVGNVIWKRVRRGDMPAHLAEVALRDALDWPVRMEADRHLLLDAWRLANGFDRSLYDSLYLALALRLRLPLVTADRRLCNALAEADWGGQVLPLDDFPESTA